MPLFAPLRMPIKRRMQTGAVLLWISGIIYMLGIFVFLCTFKVLRPLIIMYLLWAFILDRGPERGARPVQWYRNWIGWKHFAQYFPMTLVKEGELDPSKNYIFGYHPHGIISLGAFCTFGTEGLHFSKRFPGIKPQLLTLHANFQVPLYREMVMAHGCASVSRASCEHILRSGEGCSVVIVVGGAQESLSTRPGTLNLTLKKRLGFCKLALVHGASLVPTLAFGENELYEVYTAKPKSLMYKIQQFTKRTMGFTMPVFNGRGIFNYEFGLLPRRKPVSIVVGKPIHVDKVENPTVEQMQKLQSIYIDEVLSIWERYKDKYAAGRTQELCIIE